MVPPTGPDGFVGEFHTHPDVRSAYSQGAGPYRIVPGAVALPASANDLLRLVTFAAQHGMSLIPRGAGSGMPGGNVGRGIVVDLARLTRPLRVSAEKRANVGAAVTFGELNAASEHFHLRLPPNPSSGAYCTIGGMVATNAAGARSLRYGSVREWVRGIELVTADGEITWLTRSGYPQRPPRGQRRSLVERSRAQGRLEGDVLAAIRSRESAVRERFPKTTKNSSGYAIDAYLDSGDLLDLVIGSEGTLGFITRVELGLDLVPTARSTLLLAVREMAAIGDIVDTLQRHTPTAIELFDRTFLELAAAPLPHDGVEAILLVEFERPSPGAARGAVGDAVRATQRWAAHVETGLTEAEQDGLWSLRHAASTRLAELPATRRSLQIVEDGCVPIDRLGEYIHRVRQAADETGLEVVAFGHAGDGHLHVNALADTTDPQLDRRLAALLDLVTGALVELGGTVSGEHGDGRLRASLLSHTYGSEVVDLFRRIKRAFDPNNLFNPGVIVPDPDAAPLRDLKVGPHAAAIPERIGERLLSVERHGQWDRSPLDLGRNGGTTPGAP